VVVSQSRRSSLGEKKEKGKTGLLRYHTENSLTEVGLVTCAGTKIMTKKNLLKSILSEQASVIGKFPLAFTTRLGAN
jgi:hypothetical protein